MKSYFAVIETDVFIDGNGLPQTFSTIARIGDTKAIAIELLQNIIEQDYYDWEFEYSTYNNGVLVIDPRDPYHRISFYIDQFLIQ